MQVKSRRVGEFTEYSIALNKATVSRRCKHEERIPGEPNSDRGVTGKHADTMLVQLHDNYNS